MKERKFRSVELRKVVERMEVATGEVHLFVQNLGGGTRKVNEHTTYMDDEHVFTDKIVNMFNNYTKEYVFTLTEKEYPSYA